VKRLTKIEIEDAEGDEGAVNVSAVAQLPVASDGNASATDQGTPEILLQ